MLAEAFAISVELACFKRMPSHRERVAQNVLVALIYETYFLRCLWYAQACFDCSIVNWRS